MPSNAFSADFSSMIAFSGTRSCSGNSLSNKASQALSPMQAVKNKIYFNNVFFMVSMGYVIGNDETPLPFLDK